MPNVDGVSAGSAKLAHAAERRSVRPRGTRPSSSWVPIPAHRLVESSSPLRARALADLLASPLGHSRQIACDASPKWPQPALWGDLRLRLAGPTRLPNSSLAGGRAVAGRLFARGLTSRCSGLATAGVLSVLGRISGVRGVQSLRARSPQAAERRPLGRVAQGPLVVGCRFLPTAFSSRAARCELGRELTYLLRP